MQLKNIHSKMMALDIRLYMLSSVVILFLLMMPFAVEGLANEMMTEKDKMAFFMVPIYLVITSLTMMLNIFLTIGVPIIIMDKLFSRFKTPWRMILAIMSSILVMLILEAVLVGISGVSVWTLKIVYATITYYTYYLFRARKDISPVLVIFTQIVCTNLLYSGASIVNKM